MTFGTALARRWDRLRRCDGPAAPGESDRILTEAGVRPFAAARRSGPRRQLEAIGPMKRRVSYSKATVPFDCDASKSCRKRSIIGS